jgi:predicted TPR repeat methyltransferase
MPGFGLFGYAAENMLMLAKQQGGYSKLYHNDIVQFLQTTEEQFDIILLSDVLVYFGDCENLFQLCEKQLNSKGYIAFSIENSEVAPYQLDTTGRFQHHPGDFSKVLEQYFTIQAQQTVSLREQEGEEVMGSVFLCRYSK